MLSFLFSWVGMMRSLVVPELPVAVKRVLKFNFEVESWFLLILLSKELRL
jgi:hypothetical protein